MYLFFYSNKLPKCHISVKAQSSTVQTEISVWALHHSCHLPHSKPRSTIRLNDLVNLNSNSVSWGSTSHSGMSGEIIST